MGNSIFKKLFTTSLFIVIVISVIIGIISYSIASRILIDETEKYLVNELKQIDRSLQTVVEDVNQSADILQNDQAVSKVFDRSAKSSYQRYVDALEVEKLLKSAISNNDAILGFAVLTEFQDFAAGSRSGLFTYNDFIQLPVYREKVHRLQENQYALLRNDDLDKLYGPRLPSENADSGNLIILAKRMLSGDGSEVLVLSFLSTVSIMAGPTDGIVYAVDAANRIAWTGSQQSRDNPYPSIDLIAAGKSAGSIKKGDTRLIYLKSSLSNWHLVNAVSEKSILKPLSEIRLFVLQSVAVIIAICAFAAVIASRGLTIRLRRMKNALHLKGMDVRSPFPGFSGTERRSVFQWMHNMKYGTKLFAYYMCIVIVPMLLLSMLLYQKTVDILENQLEQSFRQPLVQAASGINMLMNRHIRNVKYMITNDNVQQLFVTEPSGRTEDYLKTQQVITGEIMKKTIYHAGLSSVEIFDIRGNLLYSSSAIHENSKWDPVRPESNATWLDTHADPFQNQIFSLIHEIKGNILFASGFALPIGYLKLNINETLLSQIYKDVRISDKGVVYIANRDGTIVSSNDKQLIHTKAAQIPLLSSGDKMFAAEQKLNYGDWTIHALIPADELLGSKHDLITYNLFAVSIMMLVLLIVCIQRSRVFVRPIQSLMQVIRSVRNGNLDARFHGQSGDEIEVLGRSFNGMLDRLQGLIEEITKSKLRQQELETKKREAELNALQSQINPHFLYNTFESINWLVIQNENDKAVTMMTSLADLFRIGINRGHNMVGLDEELQHAEAYITIQKIRYNDKLNVFWDIQVDAQRYRTMKLVLQPIIENAIYHGIELMEGAGTIHIKGFIEEDRLHLQIIDNGLGIEDERLTELRERFSNWYREPSRSIGLLNVNERIKLLFGDKYGLHIASKVNEGTVVTVLLPLVHRDGGEGEIA